MSDKNRTELLPLIMEIFIAVFLLVGILLCGGAGLYDIWKSIFK